MQACDECQAMIFSGSPKLEVVELEEMLRAAGRESAVEPQAQQIAARRR